MPYGEIYSTRAELRRQISRVIGEPFQRYFLNGVAIADGTATKPTQLVDTSTSRAFDGMEWKDAWLYISSGTNAGEERAIVSYTSGNGTFTVAPSFGDQAGLVPNTQYEIHWRTSATYKHELINRILRSAYPQWSTPRFVDIVICEDETYYDDALGFPLDMRRPLTAYLEPHRQGTMFTATAGTTTTVTVAETLQTNQYQGHILTVYDGTGRGQWTVVTSNNAHTLTFPALDTAPASGSKLLVKSQEDWSDGAQIADIRWELDEGDYYSAMHLPDHLQRYRGDLLRLYYTSDVELLTTDIATTYVPQEWIVAEAHYRVQLETDDPSRKTTVPITKEEIMRKQALIRQLKDDAMLLKRQLRMKRQADTSWSPPSNNSSSKRFRGQFFGR